MKGIRDVVQCCRRWKGIRALFAKLSIVSVCATTLILLFAANDPAASEPRRPSLHLALISPARGGGAGAGGGGEGGGGAGAAARPQRVFRLQDQREPERIKLARRLPQALIIGVRFGGTRALQEWMSVSPFFVAPKDPVGFFLDEALYNQGVQWYIDQMPPTWPNQTTVERNAAYFANSAGVPRRIAATNPNMKLLLITRDPTKRLVSDYTYAFNRHLRHRKGKSSKFPSFEEMVFINGTTTIDESYDALDRSVYHKHLKPWIETFSKNQIHVVDGDLFLRDPAVVMKGVEKFLSLVNVINRTFYVYDANRGYFCRRFTNRTTKCLKDRRKLTIPHIKNDTLPVVQDFFRKHNKVFFDMIQQWLPYWS